MLIKSGTSNQMTAVPFYISNFSPLIHIFAMTSVPDTDECYAGNREEQREMRYDRRRWNNSGRKTGLTKWQK